MFRTVISTESSEKEEKTGKVDVYNELDFDLKKGLTLDQVLEFFNFLLVFIYCFDCFIPFMFCLYFVSNFVFMFTPVIIHCLVITSLLYCYSFVYLFILSFFLFLFFLDSRNFYKISNKRRKKIKNGKHEN